MKKLLFLALLVVMTPILAMNDCGTNAITYLQK